jgi:hypothetical protein
MALQRCCIFGGHVNVSQFCVCIALASLYRWILFKLFPCVVLFGQPRGMSAAFDAANDRSMGHSSRKPN